MKIAYLLNSVSRKAGGLFESCRRQAQTSGGEQEITVLGVEDEFTGMDIKEWLPLRPRVFHPTGPRSFGYAPGYAKYLAAVAPELAHVHGLWIYSSLAGYQWHRRTKLPLIYTAHGMLDPWAVQNSGWKKRLVRLLWEDAAHRSAACFHVHSEAEYRTVRRHGLQNPICIIPNGIDLPRIAEDSELSGASSPFQPLAQDRKVLLYLGRIHAKKGLVNLIHAWAGVMRSRNPEARNQNDWMLAIAGWDQAGHEGELKKMTADLEIQASIAFLGPMFGANKAAAYQNADAFVLPSLSEGLPMTVLEAWSYRKPVLMTPECNLPEGFATGAALRIGTGANEIAAGLRQLLEMSEHDRIATGACGHKLVSERFSWARIGEQMRAVYEWIIGGGSAPGTLRLD